MVYRPSRSSGSGAADRLEDDQPDSRVRLTLYDTSGELSSQRRLLVRVRLGSFESDAGPVYVKAQVCVEDGSPLVSRYERCLCSLLRNNGLTHSDRTRLLPLAISHRQSWRPRSRPRGRWLIWLNASFRVLQLSSPPHDLCNCAFCPSSQDRTRWLVFYAF